jgi:hypothetical protein
MRPLPVALVPAVGEQSHEGAGRVALGLIAAQRFRCWRFPGNEAAQELNRRAPDSPRHVFVLRRYGCCDGPVV